MGILQGGRNTGEIKYKPPGSLVSSCSPTSHGNGEVLEEREGPRGILLSLVSGWKGEG